MSAALPPLQVGLRKVAMVALVEMKGLQIDFPGIDGPVRAVDGVSLELRAGEALGLVGESGSGKSLTASSIVRLLPAKAVASRGEVMYDGKDLLSMSERELNRIRGNKISMIFQDPMTSLNPSQTIGRQVGESLRLHRGMSRAQARDRVIELLKLVGIPDAEGRVDSHPHQFSGGMRQRVLIAMALACDPRIIVADEITTALDVTVQAQILDLLWNLMSRTSAAVLMITHDLSIIAGMTQRVHVMYAGQIVEKATTEELFKNPRMPYTVGLFECLPRIDRPRAESLKPIAGTLPDPETPLPGCRFAPRCRFARDVCRERQPELTAIPGAPEDHEARCWAVQDVPEGGWLIGRDIGGSGMEEELS